MKDSPQDSGLSLTPTSITTPQKQGDAGFGDDCICVASSRTESGGAIRWWWWWEIGSVLLSAGCMGLVVDVLARADNTPLSHWTFEIQPNSLISVLTVVGKTSLLVAVTSSISRESNFSLTKIMAANTGSSELKWRHFRDQERPLSELDDFDNASRGPWGALILLTRFRIRNFLAWALALVTLLAMGIEPAAQNILDFTMEQVRLDNVTASITRADGLPAKPAPAEMQTLTQYDVFKAGIDTEKLVSTAILTGILGVEPRPAFECPAPATQCSWDDFSTLGLCASVENLTQVIIPPKCGTNAVVERNSSEPEVGSFYYQCTFDYRGRRPWERPVDLGVSWWGKADGTLKNFYTREVPLFRSVSAMTESDDIGGFNASMLVVKPAGVSREVLGELTTDAPPMDMFRVEWYLCEKSFHGITATGGNVAVGSVRSGSLLPRKEASNAVPLADNTTLTTSVLTYEGSLSRARYDVDYAFLKRVLETLGRDTNISYSLICVGPVDLECERFGSITWGNMLTGPDLALPIINVTELTDRIRAHVEAVMLDYNPAVHMGQAFFPETFIRVRWEWLVLPLGVTILSVVLLVISIFSSRHQVLLKDSSIALLAHGIDGFKAGGVGIQGQESKEVLEEWAQKRRVRLGRTRDDRLVFLTS
ncbi:hypothetical protein OQA88_32 [Cercophora sp. LCS_1]